MEAGRYPDGEAWFFSPQRRAFTEIAFDSGVNLEALGALAANMNASSNAIDRTQAMVDAVLQEFMRRRKRLLAHAARGDLPLDRIAHLAMRRLPRPLALAVLRKCLAKDAANEEIWGYLAESYIAIENIADAETAIEGALEAGGPSPLVLTLRAVLAERRDRWSEAIEHWTSLQDRHLSAKGLRALARCYENTGAHRKAVAQLDRLIEIGEARPGDHYDREVLASLSAAAPFDKADSLALMQRFPGNADIAAKHSAMDFPDDPAAAPGSMPQTAEALLEYSHRLRYRPSEGPAVSLGDIEAALQAFVEQPTDFSALETCTMLLAKGDTPLSARRFLAGVSRGESGGRLTLIEADIEELAGNRRGAVTLRIAAARHCDRVRTLAVLCETLIGLERWRAAARVLDYIKRVHAETVPGLRILSRYAYRLKDFAAASHYFDRMQPLLRTVLSPHSHAGALWQIGETERAWTLLLGIVTKRRALISPKARVRDAALAEIEADLVRFRQAAEQAEEEQRLADVVRDVRTRFDSLHLLKSSLIHNATTADFLAKLTHFEELGSYAAAGALIEEKLSAVIAMTSLPQYCGDLYFRAARVFEAQGKLGKALHYLEQAIWHNKSDDLLLRHHRRILQRIRQPLSAAASGRPAVLILTWSGNLKRAERLARDIATRCGLLVFTLSGDPKRITHRIDRRAYGYRLVVPSADGYEFLAKKLLLGYRFLFAGTAVTGVLKIDDDVVLDGPEVFSALVRSCEAAEVDYGGRTNHYVGGVYHHGHRSAADEPPRRAIHGHVPYCSGFCYYLSRKSLGEIYRLGLTHFWIDNPHCVYEDVFFGEVLTAAGIEPTHLDVKRQSGMLIEAFEPLSLLGTLPPRSQ